MARINVKVPEIRWETQRVKIPEANGKLGLPQNIGKSLETMISRRSQPPKVDNKSRLIFLGIGAAFGAIAGLLFAPRTGRATRSYILQKGQRYLRVTTRQANRTLRYTSHMVTGKARALYYRVAQKTDYDLTPETIEHRVETRLGEDPVIGRLPRLNVNAEPGGVVYLRGSVPRENLRHRAELIASRVRGVTEVINEISVVPEGEKLKETGNHDLGLMRQVINKILDDDKLKEHAIEVEAEVGGTVFLRGTVHTENERLRAEKLVKGMPGVKTVVNDLAVVSPAKDVVEGYREKTPPQQTH